MSVVTMVRGGRRGCTEYMTENSVNDIETDSTATVSAPTPYDSAATSTPPEPTSGSPAGPVVVLGGAGKTGRRVSARLTERGITVRAASRSTSPRFDWADRSTWACTLAGARALYIAYQPDLAAPGADDAIAELTETARRAGVRTLVLLSGRGEPGAQRCEEIALNSGVDTTIVRCAWFAQNFSETFQAGEIATGRVVLPVDAVTEPFVDAQDIADVAVAALTEDGHTGRIYELTGPRALTFADAVAEIATATGREIVYQPIPLSDYTASMAEMGVDQEAVEALTHVFGTVLDGRNSHTTDGVERALGRAPRSFADYARRTAAAGGWPAATAG